MHGNLAPATPPGARNKASRSRPWILLVLPLVGKRAHLLCPDPVKPLFVLALCVEDVASFANADFARDRILECDFDWLFSRQAKMLPATLGKEMPCQILFVKPLHDKDRNAVFLVIMARRELGIISPDVAFTDYVTCGFFSV